MTGASDPPDRRQNSNYWSGVRLYQFIPIVMSALNIRPENILYHVRLLIQRISELGFGVFEGALGYFLLGAAVVVPVWLIARLLGALGGRSERRE